MALLDLIEQCRDASRWREAAANDPDFIVWERRHMAASGGRVSKWAPRVSELDLHAYLLMQLVNLTGTIASDRRLKKFTPLPGPRTAHERADAALEAGNISHLLGALTPGR